MALRDTLVAPDMKAAMAAAYQNGRTKHRVVTADGKLIDRSGAMTGGGNSMRRGAMRIIGRGGALRTASKILFKLKALVAFFFFLVV